MDGKQLKNSILQWAIQGKLVPQNPKEGSGDDLFQKLKPFHNNIKPCKDTLDYSSFEFEIPSNWKMVQMIEIFNFVDYRGKTPNKINKGVFLITASNIKSGFMEYTRKEYISEEEYEDRKSRGITHKGDLLFTTEAPMGNAALCDLDVCSCGQRIITLQEYKKDVVLPKLFMFFILSPQFQMQLLDNCTGTTAKGIKAEKLKHLLIPLPPLAEQKRIVAKLEQVLPLAEEYGAAQEQLDKLNKELPEVLKKSILQEAIQGKLVSQNPKDEPAQKLLERIALARHSERSEESSKRSKKTSKDQSSRIYRENGVWYERIGSATPKDITDEIPFEIPETWAWCRLGNCSDYAASKEKAKSFENIQEMWSLDLEDIEKNSGRIVKRLKVCERKIVGEKVVFKKGQVLYSKLRPYLKKILVAPEDGVCSSEIVPFSPFECLDASYLVTVLKSPHVDYTINLVTYGVKMPRVGTDTMLNLLIPIPPLAEQKRIVAKLEQLFKVL